MEYTAENIQQELDSVIKIFYGYLCQQPDVIVAYLFGSVARGRATERSDIDVGVLLVPELTGLDAAERQIQLGYALEDGLTENQPKPLTHRPEVQVTNLNRATPLLAYEVVKDGVLLYERSKEERVEFEVRAMKIYFDFKPWLDFQYQALLKRVQEGNFGKPSRYDQRRNRDPLEAVKRISERLAGTTAS